eukprot:11446755-Alexandrium_andersonii.AAC.1
MDGVPDDSEDPVYFSFATDLGHILDAAVDGEDADVGYGGQGSTDPTAGSSSQGPRSQFPRPPHAKRGEPHRKLICEGCQLPSWDPGP